MSRVIVHSSLDIVFHCVISQIPSWWWCKLFIHRLASLPAHTQPSLLPRPIARLAIPLCIVTILAFSCAALVALRPLFWSTKSPSYLKNLPCVMMMQTFHLPTSQPACPHPAQLAAQADCPAGNSALRCYNFSFFLCWSCCSQDFILVNKKPF